MARPTDAADGLANLLRWQGIERFEREYPAIPGRRFRFDLAFVPQRLLVEVDGGGWSGGRHARGGGIESDCEKQSEAVALGFRVIRVTPRQVDDGRAVEWIKRALGASPLLGHSSSDPGQGPAALTPTLRSG